MSAPSARVLPLSAPWVDLPARLLLAHDGHARGGVEAGDASAGSGLAVDSAARILAIGTAGIGIIVCAVTDLDVKHEGGALVFFRGGYGRVAF